MRHPIISKIPAASMAILLAAVPSLAPAQPAAGTMKQDAATSGSTDVATETFEAAKKAEEAKDATEAKIQAGALMSTGNSRTLAATATGTFRMRRSANELSAAVAANYARAAADRDSSSETTVENYQGKLRYDRFVSEQVALFLGLSARRDRFQGLDLRLNLDPGVAYYFVDRKEMQFWGELGYDLQYDVRRDENIEEAALDGEIVDKTDTRHSARAFLGYRHTLNDNVSFNTGLEYLQGIPDTEFWRLNWDVGLTAAIDERFSLATTFSLRYDNAPLPELATTDTQTAISLVYQLH
jgi:putative salt-induced outer membrane protein